MDVYDLPVLWDVMVPDLLSLVQYLHSDLALQVFAVVLDRGVVLGVLFLGNLALTKVSFKFEALLLQKTTFLEYSGSVATCRPKRDQVSLTMSLSGDCKGWKRETR